MPGVPVTFIDEEDEYLLAGTYHGAAGGLTVTDRTKDFRTCGLDADLELVVKNTTDESAGALTAVTEHSFTCTLAGGTNNTFTDGDEWVVLKTDTEDSIISTHYTDRLFGRKVTKQGELNEDGRFPEDEDLEDEEWSPGYPIRERY